MNFIRDLSSRVEGDFELLPVTLSNSSGEPGEYPLVQALSHRLNLEQLIADFEFLRGRLSNSYIGDRKGNLGLPLAQAKALLHGSGFLPGIYTAIGLMQIGNSEYLDEVPSYTREVLESFGARPFRAHYSIAKPGWKTELHGDATDFRQIGFRINIPLTAPAHYAFIVDGRRHDYVLEAGRAWFVNFCQVHQGSNPSDRERTSLIFQLDNDDWLKCHSL